MPEKILVVGPAWIGDAVMAQSLYKHLSRERDAVIDVIAPAWCEPLLSRMPEVHRSISMPLGHGDFDFWQRHGIGKSLRTERYARAIVLPRSMKSALAPFFADIPVRTGFRGEMRFGVLNDIRKLDMQRLDQTVKRYLALGLPRNAPIPAPQMPRLESDPENLARLSAALALNGDGRVIAMMPGAAYGPAKRWPTEYFAELARELVAGGARVWVLGSQGEAELGDAIRSAAGYGVINLCGRTQLEDTIDILSIVDAAVTNDSGLMHVAAAAGTHVVAIYGSSSVAFTPPLTGRKTILHLGLECSPCFARECPLGHLRCLRDIRPGQVLEVVRAAVAG